ncbi:MAG TPA: phytanoyl-CoA dioxygenase family protein [Lichenihabitans sp.]|nr:phytanoyl-CoA dioxygenase family protein [Lichenihabitans sp.]
MTTSTTLPAEADVQQFAQDGAVILKGVFKDWVDRLRHGIDDLMRNPSPLERSYHPKGDAAPFFQDLCNWQRFDDFRDFVLDSPAAEVAARLMHSKTARFFHDHVLVKEPGTSVVTPWHQDLPYYCVEGRQSVSFWIPLDHVPRENSLECVAGSHRWAIHKPKRFDGTDLYAEDDSVELPDIDKDRDKYTILGWAMEPGDAVAFNFRTVHGASANKARANRRRVFSARWVGDDAVFADRKGKGSPPFKHLTLKAGEKLEGPDFPVAYAG